MALIRLSDEGELRTLYVPTRGDPHEAAGADGGDLPVDGGAAPGGKRVRKSQLSKAPRISSVSGSPLGFHELIRLGPK